jgi:tellurite resistance protein
MSQAEEIAIIRTLAVVASSDGKFVPEEEALLLSIASQLGVDVAEALEGTESMSVEQMVSPVTTPINRRSFLLETVRMAYCDGTLNEKESKVINAVADVFEINASTIEAIDSWARKDEEIQRLGLDIVQNGRE